MKTTEAQRRAYKKYYNKNRDKILARRARYYQEHIENCRAYGRAYSKKYRKKGNIGTNSDSKGPSKIKKDITKMEKIEENTTQAILRLIYQGVNDY